jgi:hypothetical protein
VGTTYSGDLSAPERWEAWCDRPLEWSAASASGCAVSEGHGTLDGHTPLPALPIPRTRLIGREAEIAAARSSLLEEAVPQLTLTGPGGVGKTRLALAISADVDGHFTDGVVWIDLAPLANLALVSASVATALGVSPAADKLLADEIARPPSPADALVAR